MPSSDVVSADVGGEAVLLHVERGIYFGLGATGARIWQLISSGVAEREMVAQLATEYEADAEQVRADVAGFLNRLIEMGLAREVTD